VNSIATSEGTSEAVAPVITPPPGGAVSVAARAQRQSTARNGARP
jgi:hypothetical protein